MSNYHSHYRSRKVIEDTNKLYCVCSREIRINEVICSVCRDSSPIMEGAAEAKILENVLEMLKPIKCSDCSERFSDLTSKDKHVLISHPNSRIQLQNMFLCLKEWHLQSYVVNLKREEKQQIVVKFNFKRD